MKTIKIKDVSKGTRSSARRVDTLEGLESRRLFAAPSASISFGLTDSGFGTKGHVVISGADDTYDGVKNIVVATDGSIYESTGESVIRVTPAGKLDKTYGTNGVAELLGGTYVSEAVDSSDNLYVLVTASNNNALSTLLIKYNAAGEADGTYGNGGSAVVTTDASFTPAALAVQADGKVVVAGVETTSNNNGRELRLFRVGTDGTLDNSFGTSGSLQTYLGSTTSLTPVIYDEVLGLKVLSSGDILVGGGTISYSPNNFGSSSAYTASYHGLARVTSSGTLDSGYGTGGIRLITLASQALVKKLLGTSENFTAVFPNSFDARADGSAIFSGAITSYYQTTSGRYILSVGTDGTVVFNKALPIDPLSSGQISSVRALPDGRAVVLSYAENYQTGYALTPLAADGTVGPTVLTDDLDSSTTDIEGYEQAALAVASNGQILVGGVDQSESNLILQQLNASTTSAARPDNFANGGVNSIQVAGDGYTHVAYYDSATRDLMYVRRLRNGIWSTPIVIDAHPGAGTALSLALDSKQNPSIAYYDSKSKSLKFATSSNLGASFKLQLVDATADVGSAVSITYDVNGRPAIAYYDKTNGNLKFATTNVKGLFAVSTLDAKDNVGQDVVITEAPSNRLMIAYLDSTAGEVKFAETNSKGVFAFKNVTPATKGVESLAILNTEAQSPAIAFHDLASGDLRLSAYDTSAGKFVTHSVALKTGQGIALAASNYFDNATIYTYSKTSGKITEIQDPLNSVLDSVTEPDGGADLAISGVDGFYLAAYVNPTSGNLEVRPLNTP